MSWLRANLRHVVTTALLVGVVFQIARAAHWKGVYEAETETYERETEELDEARQMIEDLEAESAARDSTLAVLAVRDQQLRDSLLAVSEAEEATRDSLDSLLVAQADSTGGWVRVEDYLARLSAERAETGRQRFRAEIAEAAVARLEPIACPGCEEIIASLWRTLDSMEERNQTQERRIEAALAGRGAGFFSRLWDSKESLAVAFVLGAVTWEVAR